jgi:hypothetical protein
LALIGLGGAGRFLPESPLRTVAIATTVLVGALFMVFAAIDFVRYRHDAALGES